MSRKNTDSIVFFIMSGLVNYAPLLLMSGLSGICKKSLTLQFTITLKMHSIPLLRGNPAFTGHFKFRGFDKMNYNGN